MRIHRFYNLCDPTRPSGMKTVVARLKDETDQVVFRTTLTMDWFARYGEYGMICVTTDLDEKIRPAYVLGTYYGRPWVLYAPQTTRRGGWSVYVREYLQLLGQSE